MKDKAYGKPLKVFEDTALQGMLSEDFTQTQSQLVEKFTLTQKIVTELLHVTEEVQKGGKLVVDENWIYFDNPKRIKSSVDPVQPSTSTLRPNYW
ncbi:hypothetical protein NPIL_1891 [Nephila pilipes]|uniref:Uncharacterized protein n=1 Tax=Nephila pilipes TaxID=299642 RepID=A0A8X6Q026_NEPPI|nr:hypothetical protein NPIL_1891 [Nephila pilipes]